MTFPATRIAGLRFQSGNRYTRVFCAEGRVDLLCQIILFALKIECWVVVSGCATCCGSIMDMCERKTFCYKGVGECRGFLLNIVQGGDTNVVVNLVVVAVVVMTVADQARRCFSPW